MMHNILSDLNSLIIERENLKQNGKKVVFTNGCFDILHAGHVDYLVKAKKCGDILIVGLNSDASVRIVKGKNRPIVNEAERAYILYNLKPVDYVILFDDSTPQKLIETIMPDVLVKGSDWTIDNIVGREVVEKNGGEVKRIDFVTSRSTTNIVEKVLATYNGK